MWPCTAVPSRHLQITVDEVHADGDRVVLTWVARSTAAAEVSGNAPHETHGTVTGKTVSRIADGRIVESWTTWDQGAVLEHVGLISAAGCRSAIVPDDTKLNSSMNIVRSEHLHTRMHGVRQTRSAQMTRGTPLWSAGGTSGSTVPMPDLSSERKTLCRKTIRLIILGFAVADCRRARIRIASLAVPQPPRCMPSWSARTSARRGNELSPPELIGPCTGPTLLRAVLTDGRPMVMARQQSSTEAPST